MNYLNLIGYILVPFLSIILIPIIRSHFVRQEQIQTDHEERLKIMESHIQMKLTEAEVRQILNDKIEPVKEMLSDCKDKLDKITDHLLKN